MSAAPAPAMTPATSRSAALRGVWPSRNHLKNCSSAARALLALVHPTGPSAASTYAWLLLRGPAGPTGRWLLVRRRLATGGCSYSLRRSRKSGWPAAQGSRSLAVVAEAAAPPAAPAGGLRPVRGLAGTAAVKFEHAAPAEAVAGGHRPEALGTGDAGSRRQVDGAVDRPAFIPARGLRPGVTNPAACGR